MVIIFLLYLVYMFTYILLNLLPDLKYLQQSEYVVSKLIKHKFKKHKKELLRILLNFSIISFSYFFNLITIRLIILMLLFNNAYFIFLLVYNKFIFDQPIYTKRIKKNILIFLVLNLLYIILSINSKYLLYIVVYMTISCDIMSIISIFCSKIYEVILQVKYVKIASQKLKRSNIVTVAVTGSYAKTSVKNILTTILKEKFSVLMTPESYNTPNGISITINKNNLKLYDVFIVEMGAKKKGEIAYLCKQFSPDYAVITAIGEQHLESFKNIDTILKTKTEVVDFVKSDVIYNFDNKYLREYFVSKSCKNLCVGMSSGDIYARVKNFDFGGSDFDIYYCKKYYCSAHTKLTGKHNVLNILLAVGVAIKMGLSPKEISLSISKLEPVKSRMEKSVLPSGAIIINNGYNSNPDSAKSSIELINLYKNKRKIIITPGFVEMGDQQFRLNMEFGKLIAQNVDECIVVNKVNRDAILQGLIDSDFRNYIIIDRFKNIDFSQFGKDDIVLIENDLPDNYE